jgi:photosystem II stability/assembly factor-like uncharacterized protein
LAIVAYQLLTGQVPFEADSIVGLLYKVTHEPPPPILQVRPDLPAQAGAVFDRVMAKAPVDRYPTVTAFVKDLEQALGVTAGSVAPPATPVPIATLSDDVAERSTLIADGQRPQPGSQPGMPPGSQPGIHPASQPGMPPGSQPGTPAAGPFWRRMPVWAWATGGLIVLVLLVLLVLGLLRGCAPDTPSVTTPDPLKSPLESPLGTPAPDATAAADEDATPTADADTGLRPTSTPMPAAVDNAWVPRGPAATSIQVNHLARASADSNGVYAATDRGLYYSEDGGERWDARSFGLGHYGELFISALAVDPGDGQTVVVGTWGYGLLRSTDGGQRWSRLADPLDTLRAGALDRQERLPVAAGGPSYDARGAATARAEGARTPVRCVALRPGDSSEIVACLDDGRGLYRSTDGGSSWRKLNVGQGSARQFAFAPADPQVQYAAFGTWTESGGLYRSTDGGDRWEAIGAETIEGTVLALAVHPAEAETVLVGTADGALYRSTDGGATWSQVGTALEETAFHALVFAGDVVYAGGDAGLYISTDDGLTWTVATRDFEGPMRAVAGMAEGALLVGAGQFPTGGVYKRAASGADFALKLDGMQDIVVVDTAITADALYLATWGAGVFRSADDGATWSRVDLAAPYVSGLTVVPDDPPVVWAATAYSDWGFFRGTDGGRTWDEVGARSPAAAAFDVAVADGTPARLVAATYAGTYYSVDGGETWSPGRGLTAPTLRVCHFPGSTHWLAATYGGGVFYSPGGQAWYAANGGLPATEAAQYIYDLACGEQSGGTAYAAGADIYQTQDYGAHWRAMGAALPDDYFGAVAASPDGRYVLGGSSRSGVYLHARGSWSPLNANLDEQRIRSLAVVAEPRVQAFAGTGGQGAWSYRLMETSTRSRDTVIVYLPLVSRSMASLAGERYEANNTLFQARAVGMPGQLASYIEAEDDEDFYRFDVRTTAPFTVALSQLPTGMDYDLELYDSNRAFVAGSYWPAGDEETIIFQPTATGRYYVRVYSSGGSNAEAAYQLTLTQAPEATVAGALYGTVTEGGRAVANVPIVLYYDNGYRVTRINTLTERDGTYRFRNLPDLPAGHTYSVVYPNYEGDTDRLAYWICRSPAGYAAGEEVEVCAFDVAAVTLKAPAHESVVESSVTFSWAGRDVAEDEYYVRVQSRDGRSVWRSDALARETYALDALPEGFENDVAYQWDVLVANAMGYGVSPYYRQITFAARAQESKVDTPGEVQYPSGVTRLPPLPDLVIGP